MSVVHALSPLLYIAGGTVVAGVTGFAYLLQHSDVPPPHKQTGSLRGMAAWSVGSAVVAGYLARAVVG